MVEGVKAMEVMGAQATVPVMTLDQVLVTVEQVGFMEGEAIVALVGTIHTQGRIEKH